MRKFNIPYFNSISRITVSVTLIILVACNETPEKNPADRPLTSMADSVLTYNRQIVESEIQEIDDFMRRYHWEMKTTPTGLHYMIYQKGKGPGAKQGDIVTIYYKINLLNGDTVVLPDSNNLYTVLIGKRNVVCGLEEGIMLMNQGSRAKLIVPSHLAYGLLGDLAAIPSRAALVFDVELRSIQQAEK